MNATKISEYEWIVAQEYLIRKLGQQYRVWHDGTAWDFSSLERAKQFIHNLLTGMRTDI